MGIRKKQLTQEQLDWRRSILRGRVDRIKNSDSKPKQDVPHQELEAPLTKDEEIQKCFFFLNNCVFWVNEYIDGAVGKDRLLETARVIQQNAKKLEQLLS